MKSWCFDNPKRKQSSAYPGEPSTSQPMRNMRRKKTLLCVRRDDRETVYYVATEPGETITGDRTDNNWQN